jgi:hypothetical protein
VYEVTPVAASVTLTARPSGSCAVTVTFVSGSVTCTFSPSYEVCTVALQGVEADGWPWLHVQTRGERAD